MHHPCVLHVSGRPVPWHLQILLCMAALMPGWQDGDHPSSVQARDAKIKALETAPPSTPSRQPSTPPGQVEPRRKSIGQRDTPQAALQQGGMSRQPPAHLPRLGPSSKQDAPSSSHTSHSSIEVRAMLVIPYRPPAAACIVDVVRWPAPTQCQDRAACCLRCAAPSTLCTPGSRPLICRVLQAHDQQRSSEESVGQAAMPKKEDVQHLQHKYDAACHSAQSAEKRAQGLQSELSSVLAQLQVGCSCPACVGGG